MYFNLLASPTSDQHFKDIPLWNPFSSLNSHLGCKRCTVSESTKLWDTITHLLPSINWNFSIYKNNEPNRYVNIWSSFEYSQVNRERKKILILLGLFWAAFASTQQSYMYLLSLPLRHSSKNTFLLLLTWRPFRPSQTRLVLANTVQFKRKSNLVLSNTFGGALLV